jgi:hypothetical protein
MHIDGLKVALELLADPDSDHDSAAHGLRVTAEILLRMRELRLIDAATNIENARLEIVATRH